MSLQTRLSDLITAIGADYKQLRIWSTGSSTGDLTGLSTTNKTSLVAAVNEIFAKTYIPPDASETVKGIVKLASLADLSTGTDSLKAVTAAGVRQERTALKAEILGANIPEALDTLQEFAAALGNDPNYAATITTSLGNKQTKSADLTAIAALVSAADKFPYATGAGSWALAAVTSAGRGLLAAADSASQRSLLSVYSQSDLGDPTTDLGALYTTAKS